MSANRTEGSSSTALIAVLVLLAALGAYNYQRNLRAERAEMGARPFAGYESQQLAQLADAYSHEVELSRRRYAAEQKRRQPSKHAAALVGERVREFDRVHQQSANLRALQADLARRETRLQEVEKERAYRRTLAAGLAIHLQRLTRI